MVLTFCFHLKRGGLVLGTISIGKFISSTFLHFSAGRITHTPLPTIILIIAEPGCVQSLILRLNTSIEDTTTPDSQRPPSLLLRNTTLSPHLNGVSSVAQYLSPQLTSSY